jgi:hypothetical protein
MFNHSSLHRYAPSPAQLRCMRCCARGACSPVLRAGLMRYNHALFAHVLRLRARECADSSQEVQHSPNEKVSRSLGAAVARWEACRLTDNTYYLDGCSHRCLHRCIAYQYTGAANAAKMLLCEPSAYVSYPVCAPSALLKAL